MIAPQASKANLSARVKTEFMGNVLTDTPKLIREMQTETAEQWGLFNEGNHKSGELKRSLQGHFSVANQDGAAKLSMRVLAYSRFLDIPDKRRTLSIAKREGYHLYNRIVFGILYNNTWQKLSYGFTEEVRERMYNRLLASVGGNETRAQIIMKQNG